MANLANAGPDDQTHRMAVDFAEADKQDRLNPRNVQPPAPLSSLLTPAMARALEKGPPNSHVGQFCFTKELIRGARGNDFISRQLFEVTPERPYGPIPSGNAGAVAYPPR
jgi:hypothetical protein